MKQDDFLETEDILRKIMKKIPKEWKRHIDLNFSRTEMLVLYELYYNGQQRSSEMATTLSVTTGGLTGLTDKLVHGGYVERERDKNDRRVVYLTITGPGEQVLQSMFEARKTFIEQLFQGVTMEELNAFKKTADKLLHNIEQNEID